MICKKKPLSQSQMSLYGGLLCPGATSPPLSEPFGCLGCREMVHVTVGKKFPGTNSSSL